MRGEDLGVFAQGTVEILNSQHGEPAADWPHPHWMSVHTADIGKLTAVSRS
ncbi:hypothetical protein [Actinomadura geliboluensis]|uniref:hypothetical protein n=1 Tax=Actinomadura geliboluensis TaxID=882440 RepID=UPI00367569D0